MNHQLPNSKHQINSNTQKLITKQELGHWNLVFGYYLIIGIWCLVIALAGQGCGNGAVIEQLSPPSEPGDKTSLNLSPQEEVFVAASLFTDPVGSIATVGLNNPHTVQNARAVTDGSDILIRSYEGKIFVINRGVTSTIQVIDPDSFKVIGDYSVGAGSNPQGLVVANGKAFITRLDSQLDGSNKDDLWVVEPLTGKLLASIDLKPLTTNDGDRLARAYQMTLVGDVLCVLLQDLSKTFEATTNGKVAIIDTKTNSITQTIPLIGRNPTDIAYSAGLGRIFITDMGVFDSHFNNDVTTPYGGVEVIDIATNTSLGILIDDADFGGYVSTLRLASDNLGLLTVKAATIATFDPKNLKILNKNLYLSPGTFVSDLLIDKNGLLWIPERNPKNAGMLLMDPSTGATIGGPFPVGSLPISMTLIK